MYQFIKIILIACLISLAQCSEAPADETVVYTARDLKLEITQSISTQELSAMMPPKMVKTKYNGFIEFRKFGYEWYPSNGENKTTHFLLVGLGDLGEKPVGIKISAPFNSIVVYDETKSKEYSDKLKQKSAAFCISNNIAVTQPSSSQCISISVDKTGAVYSGEKLLGRVGEL
jgi:hypothetical protein